MKDPFEGEGSMNYSVRPGHSGRGSGADPEAHVRYFNSGNAFDIKLPRVPRHQFLAEWKQAFDPATGTALIPLDLSDALGTPYPATVPLALTCYLRLGAGDRMATAFNSTGEVYYVFEGRGTSRRGDHVIAWGSGDIFVFPGGGETVHAAEDEDCVLWAVTNEPELRFHGLRAIAEESSIPPTYYPAERTLAELEAVHNLPDADKMAGYAVVFSSDAMEASRNILPSLSLAMNSLPPHQAQRAHRHNAVAITVSLEGTNCYSLIEGERIDWRTNAVMVTPPGEVHSHHNDGDGLMRSLIVQDGGLHYYTRTMGFRYAEPQA